MTPAARRKKAHSDLDHAISAMEDDYRTRNELSFYRVVHNEHTDERTRTALWAARAAIITYHREGLEPLSGKIRLLVPRIIRRLAPVILDMILDAEEEQG